MAVELKAGTLDDLGFGGSMAEEIEKEMALLIGELPDSPGEVRNRRVLFVAIARGVVRHLLERQAAFTVAIGSINTTVKIEAEDVEL